MDENSEGGLKYGDDKKMKINKITETHENIIVEVEGFPHAQPVFDLGLTPEELQIKVDEWAIKQSEIDSLNNGTATPEVIAKYEAMRLEEERLKTLPQVIPQGIEVPKIVLQDTETGIAYAFVADGPDLVGGFEQHASPTPDDATLAQRMLEAKQARRALKQEIRAERDALNVVIETTKALNAGAFNGDQKTLIQNLLKALVNTQQECKRLSASVLTIIKG